VKLKLGKGDEAKADYERSLQLRESEITATNARFKPHQLAEAERKPKL
jgi:hypothetical protein